MRDRAERRRRQARWVGASAVPGSPRRARRGALAPAPWPTIASRASAFERGAYSHRGWSPWLLARAAGAACSSCPGGARSGRSRPGAAAGTARGPQRVRRLAAIDRSYLLGLALGRRRSRTIRPSVIAPRASSRWRRRRGGPRSMDLMTAAHVALLRAAGPRLPRAQRLDRLRLAPRALRRRAVARARDACSRRRASSRPGDRDALLGGARRGRARARGRARSPFRDDDEDIHMAIERRVTELAGPVGGQAAHRALAQRPGGHRRGACSCAPTRSARDRALRALMATLRRASPSATSTGRCPATRTCSARSPSTSRHHLLAYFWMLERDRDALRAVVARRPASCRSARARWPA